LGLLFQPRLRRRIEVAPIRAMAVDKGSKGDSDA
jgi:hypothetical protein